MRISAFTKATQMSLLVVNVVLLTGCQSSAEEEQEATQTVEAPVKKEAQTANYKKLVTGCSRNMSPPVKDRSKIKQLLFKQGIATKDMSEEKIQQLISDYIAKKNQAYKTCNK